MTTCTIHGALTPGARWLDGCMERRWVTYHQSNAYYGRQASIFSALKLADMVRFFEYRMAAVFSSELRRGSADEEPLVYRAVDLLGGEVLVLGEGRKLGWVDTGGGVADSQVGANHGQRKCLRSYVTIFDSHRDLAGLGLAGDELLPRLGALADDIHGIATRS